MDPHTRTTSDYQSPVVAPKIKAVLEEALKDDEIIDVDAADINLQSATKSKAVHKEKRVSRAAAKHKLANVRWVIFHVSGALSNT